MDNLAAIVLAAGRGTRMKSDTPKVLHQVCGRPMVYYVVSLIKALGVKKAVFITGFGSDEVEKHLGGFKAIRQGRLQGTGDAVKKAKTFFRGFSGNVLVTCADAPLLSEETIKKLLSFHRSGKYACTILTAIVEDPASYGRIIRDWAGNVAKIVEDKNATPQEKTVREVNVGTYCFDAGKLFKHIEDVEKNEVKKEYYLTDSVEIFNKNALRVGSVVIEDDREMLGINSRAELAQADRLMRQNINKALMEKGVTIVDPDNTYIEDGVSIGRDTIIYPGTVIDKLVTIGKRCSIGPFSHIRSEVVISDGVAIGNFAEVARARIGSGTKIKHHCYVGDADIGKNVNIGAGAITANYDGKKKNKTIIGRGAFIGSNSVLVAPVKIGAGAVVGAGSVVPKGKNVSANAVVAGVPALLLNKNKKNK